MRSAWIFTIFLFIAVSLAITLDSADCTLPRVRQRFRSLTSAQQNYYLRAVQELKNYQEVPYAGATYTLPLYDIFSLTHSSSQDAAYAHGSDGFFVWHRHYMWLYETALQEVVTIFNKNLQATGATTGFLDACVTVPYWDWENDYQKETQCSLFNSATFGSYSENACVTDGMFKNWGGAQGYCIYRSLNVQTNGGISCGSAQIINYITSRLSYTNYRSDIEGQPHGSVHNWIGGEYGDMGNMVSPNDPIFFVHHSNIDRLWALWQDCYDYDKLTSTSQITSTIFPTSFPQGANPSIRYQNNQNMPYTVDLDGSTFQSYRFSTPVTPLQIQSMGYKGVASNGMYYAYGPDQIVTSINSNKKYSSVCKFDNLWVNYTPPPTSPSSKRSLEQNWFGYSTSPSSNSNNGTQGKNDTSEENCLFGSKRLETVMDNIERKYSRHAPTKKLHYLALWECSYKNRLPGRNYSVPLKWCKMNNLNPADWKTVCEKEGQTNGYELVADMEEQQLATNDQNQQPAWVLPVSISAGVVVLLVIIAVVVIFIVRRNRSEEQY